MQLCNHRLHKIGNCGVNSNSIARRFDPMGEQGVVEMDSDLLDQIPVKSSTILGLDILLHEPFVDLGLVSELVLSDVGATIHILRLIGGGCEFDELRPRRMADCLASLDFRAWFSAISERTFVCDQEHASTTALWEQCRQMAEFAEFASVWQDRVSPEEAYLVGLLHGIGAIPTVLGWPDGGVQTRILMENALPLFVVNAMRGVDDPRLPSDWKFILSIAYEVAEASRASALTESEDVSEMEPIQRRCAFGGDGEQCVSGASASGKKNSELELIRSETHHHSH